MRTPARCLCAKCHPVQKTIPKYVSSMPENATVLKSTFLVQKTVDCCEGEWSLFESGIKVALKITPLLGRYSSHLGRYQLAAPLSAQAPKTASTFRGEDFRARGAEIPAHRASGGCGGGVARSTFERLDRLSTRVRRPRPGSVTRAILSVKMTARTKNDHLPARRFQ